MELEGGGGTVGGGGGGGPDSKALETKEVGMEAPRSAHI